MLRSLLSFLSRSFTVEGWSMSPTLLPGTRVRVSPLPYLWRSPRKGDIVLVKAVGADRYDVKRVQHVPGEWTETGVKLGEKEYFLVGDNWKFSYDSRSYGPVKAAAILGKVLAHMSESRLAISD